MRIILVLLLPGMILTGLTQDSISAAFDEEFRKAELFYNQATALANSDDGETREQELNRQALLAFRSLQQQLPETNGFDSIRFFTAFRIAELEHYFDSPDQALLAYQQAISIKLGSNLPDSLLFKPYLYLGHLYYHKNDYDSAALYYQLAEKVQEKYDNSLQEIERLYNVLGVINYEKGDYRHARNYIQKSIELLPSSHPYYRELYTNYNINLAQAHFRLEDFDEANSIYQKLLALPYRTNLHNEILHNLGVINLHLGAARKAVTYFRQVEYPAHSKNLIRLYNNLGNAFLNLEMPDSAHHALQTALSINDRLGPQTDLLANGMTLHHLGELEMYRKNYLSAIRHFHQAIHSFYPAFTDTSVQTNPEDFTGIFSYINLFNSLTAKAEAFHQLYATDSTRQWAARELDAYKSAFRLLAYVEATYNSDDARLFLNRIKHNVHSRPIDIAYQLYILTGRNAYLRDLYSFDQQNKASILSFKQMTDHLAPANSPLTKKERDLRTEITRLSLRAANTTDTATLQRLSSGLRDLEIELGKVQDQIVKSDDYPLNRVPPLKKVQDMLDRRTMLVSYHLSENNLTIFTMTAKTVQCIQKPLFEGFRDTVASFVESLRKPEGIINHENQSALYNLLLPELHNISRLIIIPDDELNYLPFEALGRNGEYLIENISIQYQYSTSLLQQERFSFSGHNTLAFAPFTSSGFTAGGLKFDRLAYSSDELHGIRGRTFTGNEAAKENFLSAHPGYKVLHFATHAVANQESGLSFISFSPRERTEDFLLFTGEIYNLQLHQTRLVILSACETGSGSLEKGEGIMSLSRAFSYAGCRNVITTLWQANDFSTAYITRKVHEYLDQDFTIDRAVRQAKSDYLSDSRINPRLKHPYYWSHIVFIGNYAPDKLDLTWVMISAVVVFILILIFYTKYRR